ncbi:MAG: hypothetical protein P8Y69_07960 [Gammaproteobacteria bacterium]
MKVPLIPTLAAVAAVATLSVGATAYAGQKSSTSEMRGYQACLDANKEDFRGLTPAREYLLADSNGLRTYYINATAWQDGERVSVGFTCTTSLHGRMVDNAGASFTRYVPSHEQPVRVAGN